MKALEAGMVVYYASLVHLIADLKTAEEQTGSKNDGEYISAPTFSSLTRSGIFS